MSNRQLKISARCGKIVDVYTPHNFKTPAMIAATMPNGHLIKVYVKMADIRRLVDNMIGHHCNSIEKIREIFTDYAIGKCYVGYTEYKGSRNWQTVNSTGWTIL